MDNVEEKQYTSKLNIPLSKETADKLFEGCETITVPKNTVLFRQEEPSDMVYLVCKGMIEQSAMNSFGKKKTFGFYFEGCVFGEIRHYLGTETIADARTLQPAILKKCPADEFIKRVVESGLLVDFLENMAQKFHKLYTQLLLLATYSTKDNLYLLQESESKLTQQQLADYLGSSREHLARILIQDKKHNPDNRN